MGEYIAVSSPAFAALTQNIVVSVVIFEAAKPATECKGRCFCRYAAFPLKIFD